MDHSQVDHGRLESTARSRATEVAGYLVPVAWLGLLLAAHAVLSPAQRLLGATVGLLLAIKLGAVLVLRGRGVVYRRSPLEWLVFFTVWPGVRPDRFGEGDHEPDSATFVRGYTYVLLGIVVIIATVTLLPALGTTLTSWLFLFGLLAVVHFGVGCLLPFGLRLVGIDAPNLFARPGGSRSVGEFWSERWNLPFVHMNRLFLTRPLRPRVGIGVAAVVALLISGLLHELAISYPAGGGWGGPLVYFAIQAGLYWIEGQLSIPDRSPWLGRLWAWVGVLGPLPLLFHGPFRETFLVPPLEVGHAVLLAPALTTYLAVALWLGAAGHFLVLVASSQVPRELEWDEELSQLSALNRKLMWTYGGFIVLTIVAFGVLTALFHDTFVAGTPLALGLSAFIALFWATRIGVDLLYFTEEDWPTGLRYEVGRPLLLTLFLGFVAIYGGTVLVHLR